MTPRRAWWTVAELARELGLSEETVRRHCRAGRIVAVREDWRWVVRDDEVRRVCQLFRRRGHL